MEKKKNKGGRPPRSLTPEQVSQVEALASVLSLEQVADYLGMSKTTFYAIMERDPAVCERYKKGKARAIGAVAQGLLKKARDGDTTSAIFYLKTQAGWKEGMDKQIIDHTSSDGSMTPKGSINIGELSDSAMAEILKARDAADS